MSDNRKIKTGLIATSAFSLCAFVGYLFLTPNASDTQIADISDISQQNAQVDEENGLIPSYSIGDSNAPVTLTVLTEYTSPETARFFDHYLNDITSSYVDRNQLKIDFINYHHNRYSVLADALVQSLETDDARMDFAKTLYAQRSRWILSDVDAVRDALTDIANEEGIETDVIAHALYSNAYSDILMKQSEDNRSQDLLHKVNAPSYGIQVKGEDNIFYKEPLYLIDRINTALSRYVEEANLNP